MDQDGWAAIEEAVVGGDLDRVIDLCIGLDEAARRGCSRRAAELAKRFVVGPDDHLTAEDWPRRGEQIRASTAALACVGPPPRELTPLGRRLGDVVRSRPRAWRDEWAQCAVKLHYGTDSWLVLRELVRAGDCTRPDGDDYLRTMVHVLGPRRTPPDRLRGALLDDPQLLAEDVWGLFELEERVLSVTPWGPALLALANEGTISRDRLLDACLAALGRDFKPAVAQTFSVFHEQIAPNEDELAARQDTYLRLLASPLESTVGLALRQLTRLQRAGRLDAAALAEHLSPALAVRSKAHAHRAVALLGRAMKDEPAVTAEGIGLLIDALSHEAHEVQTAAIAILERQRDLLDAGERDRLRGLVALVDPSNSARVAALAAVESAAPGRRVAVARAAVTVPGPIKFDPESIPRLRPGDAVTPIEEPEELIELAVVMLERPEDPDDLERLADGISRIPGHRVSEVHKAAVLARVDRVLARSAWPVAEASAAVALLTHRWLSTEPTRARFETARGPRAALGRRLDALGGYTSGPLLSAPTHRGGWIDPMVLVSRLRRSTVDDDDLAQALLRLAPDRTGQAAAALDEGYDDVSWRVGHEVWCLVRAAVGAGIRMPLLRLRTSFPASWDAVLALKAPDSIAPQPHPVEVTYKADPTPASACCPARLLSQLEPGRAPAMDANMRRWLTRVWPANLEPYYAIALRRVRTYPLLMSERERETLEVELEPLLRPDEPLGPAALDLLATALGSTHANRLAATDVVVHAIGTRRLPTLELGNAIAAAMLAEAAVPDRWADSLGPIPAISALHAHEIQQLLEAILGSLGTDLPRMSRVVDLLRSTAQAADAQITNPAARDWLKLCGSRGKTGQFAGAALAVTGGGAARSIDAAAAAAEAGRELALRRGSGVGASTI